MDAVSLPRHAVVEMLHRAQIAPQGVIQGLLMEGGRHGLELLPLPAEARPEDVPATLGADARRPLAYFRSSMESAGAARGDQDVEWLSLAPLCLSVSLGTRGVLQLRAWRRVHGHLQEIDVELAEETEKTQGKGTSSVA